MTIWLILAASLSVLRAEEGDSAQRYSPSYWARPIRRECAQGERTILVTLSHHKPDKVVAALGKSLEKDFDGLSVDPACPTSRHRRRRAAALGREPLVVEYWLKNSDIARLQSEIHSFGELKSWNLVGTDTTEIDESAAWRWKTLKNELEKSPGSLEKAPYLSAFLKNELARLEPRAKSFLRTQGRALVRISIYLKTK